VFPGPRINAEYGATVSRALREPPRRRQRQRPDGLRLARRSFITHLHNGHTAAESDGNPAQGYRRFAPLNRFTHEAAYEPGEWVDNLYLGYPAGGDDREKQSFFWFHDHVHGHTGANVYKGMVGLMPIYDPVMDNGDERTGYRLPGARTDYADGSFDVDYDIPMALYDCRMDDGVTPHKDAHNGHGETHPEWWGKTYFRHFPNHGFVGDVFTVNGTAYPVLEVKRRKYRLRFLDASISRIYNLQLMTGHPKAARDLGYTGDELQGQYRLPDGQQCMKWSRSPTRAACCPSRSCATDFELWPAKRREFVVDFTKYMDGSYTKAGDELYLVNTMKMTTGRMWDAQDPAYMVPVMKIVIGGRPARAGRRASSRHAARARPGLVPAPSPRSRTRASRRSSSSAAAPTPTRRRSGSSTASSSSRTSRSSSVTKDSGRIWRIRNGGGGWVHPFHLHMEEHRVVARNGKLAPTAATRTTRQGGRRRAGPERGGQSSPAGSGPSPARTWPTATTSPTRTTR
jgi:FtsP/CotA-like multicopper oxidase with cupredoxin domain